jgi:hypothetical protein
VKVGAENRRKVATACGLSVIALLLVGHWIFGSQSSAFAHEAGNATNPATPTHPLAKTKTKRHNSDSLDPTLRLSQLEVTEHEVYEGTGRNIFQSLDEDQPVKIQPVPKPMKDPPNTILVAAAAPPLGLKFFGVATASGSPHKVCLTQDGDVFIGSEGDIIDRRYKILHITTNDVEIEDLLESKQYTLQLQQ